MERLQDFALWQSANVVLGDRLTPTFQKLLHMKEEDHKGIEKLASKSAHWSAEKEAGSIKRRTTSSL